MLFFISNNLTAISDIKKSDIWLAPTLKFVANGILLNSSTTNESLAILANLSLKNGTVIKK